MNTIKLFIIDDSAIVRQTISKLIEDEPEIELLGVAADPLFAMQKFKMTGIPDVLILDIEMPRMDGITFLKKIMSEQPIATIVCSTLAQTGAHKGIEALQAGALELIAKPNIQTKEFLEHSKTTLLNSIKTASKAKLKIIPFSGTRSNTSTTLIQGSNTIVAPKKAPIVLDAKKIVAIGSSTGGVQVIEEILTHLPESTVPILITQHMPSGFTASLARRLDALSAITVKQAEDFEEIHASTAYIAPGDKHMLVERMGMKYVIRIKEGPKVSQHRPSVDVLFRSMSNELGSSGIGIICTGMGSDGAHGMKEMFDAGAQTYAQDEKSCIVYGMPHEAVKLGGVSHSLSIEKMIELIQSIH